MTKQVIIVLIIVLVFGFYVPWRKGFDFLDPLIILAYACIALLFVAPASADAFAATGEGAIRGGELLRKGAVVLGYGWGISVLMLMAGLLTVNVMYRHRTILAPSGHLLTAALALSLTGSVLIIAVNALLARRYSPGAIKGILRVVFLVLLLAAAFGNRFLSEDARLRMTVALTTSGIIHLCWMASAVCAVLGLALLAVAWRSAD